MREREFIERIRFAGDLAGVFEYDEETAYFYLYEVGGRVLDALQICTNCPSILDQDVDVRWDKLGHKVALFVNGAFCAMFVVSTREKFGGDWCNDRTPPLLPRGVQFEEL